MSHAFRLLLVLAMVGGGGPAACASPAKPLLPPAAHLAEPRAGHSTSPLPDGRLLVIGGFRKGADGHTQLYSATTEIIDVARRSVTAGPRLAHARTGHAAITLGDGRILVAGGWDDAGILASAEIYDPRTARVRAVADMTEPRGGFAATLLADGRVLLCGGGDNLATPTAELFDPTTDRFTATGSLRTARLGHTATLLADGRVLVVGGAAANDDVLASAELYDPRAGTFHAAGPPAIARYKHAAIALPDGRVLIVGGSSARDWTGKYDTSELYDPVTDRFSPGPQLTTPRFKLPQAVTLLGPDVAVGGGATTVELVRPGVPSRAIARLGRAAYVATATAVGTDLVVIGGYDDRLRATNDVWIIHR